MGKLLIFWMICVFAKAIENRNDPKFVRAFEEYERSDPAPRAVRKVPCSSSIDNEKYTLTEEANCGAPKNVFYSLGHVPRAAHEEVFLLNKTNTEHDIFRPTWTGSLPDKRMENPAWGNPCDLANGPDSEYNRNLTTEDVTIVANQAKAALDEAQKFKDLFACSLQSYDVFDEAFEAGPWLQNFKFVNEYVFPKEKNKIDKELPTEYLKNVTNDIPLLTLYKTLKMVAAGLYAIKENGLQDLVKEKKLKPYFDVTFNRVRQVLCVFYEVLASFHFTIPSLMDDEVPSLKANRVDIMFRIYRDTMLYLDYLRQVMNQWAADKRYADEHSNHFHYYINKTTYLDYTLPVTMHWGNMTVHIPSYSSQGKK